MITSKTGWWPALAPLPPALARDRLQVERHARVLRAIVARHLMTMAAHWLRNALGSKPRATHA
jgi:hypothetical protein